MYRTKTLTFKSLFFYYTSFQENYKLLTEKHLFFTHATTTLRTEADPLAALKTHKPSRSTEKGPCQTREGVGLPA